MNVCFALRRCFTFFFLAAAIISIVPLHVSAQLDSAQKLIIRDGLPNFAQKLSGGDSVTVAFIGGSITQGGGENAFAVKIPEWIQTQYPSVTVISVNAGIGSTNSIFGAERYDEHILKHNPDLVFIEFAVNDGNDSSCMAAMESIVRKSWMHDPFLDVVFIYTTTYWLARNTNYYPSGFFHPAASIHEQVAKFYSVPTIGMSVDIAEAFLADTSQKYDLWHDLTHPGVAGYEVYNNAITTALPALFSAGTAGTRTLKNDTLFPGLVVYPTVVVEPLPMPIPYVNQQNDTADVTYELPVPNVHWFDEAVYADGATVRWSLHTINLLSYGRVLDTTVGTAMSTWGAPMNWVSSYFENPRHYKAFYSEDRKTRIQVNGNYMPVVAFICPGAGRYGFEVTSDGGYINYYDSVALNAVHFKSGAGGQGTSKAFVKYLKADMTPGTNVNFSFDVAADMAGDTVAFILDANAAKGAPGYLDDFRIRVGYYPDSQNAAGAITPKDRGKNFAGYSVQPGRILVRIDEPGTFRIALMRMDGRSIVRRTVHGSVHHTLDRATIPAGLYLLDIRGKGRSFTRVLAVPTRT